MKLYQKRLLESLPDEQNIKRRTVAAAGVIVRRDENDRLQLLLIQRSASDHWPNHWEFPRGKCDQGDESKPRLCAKREIKEETGLDVKIVEIVDTFQYLADGGERLTTCYNYLCELSSKNQEVKLSNEHQDYKWISEMSEVDLMVLPDQKRTIEKILNPDRTISSTPENDFTKNNKIEEITREKYNDLMKIEILVRDPDYQLVKMIDHIRRLAAPGHSFEVVVDPDVTKEEGKRSFGMDGDGSFHIRELKMNGKKFELDGDGKIVEGYLKFIQW
jgi:8-oxo-dGTP diphosphatase